MHWVCSAFSITIEAVTPAAYGTLLCSLVAGVVSCLEEAGATLPTGPGEVAATLPVAAYVSTLVRGALDAGDIRP